MFSHCAHIGAIVNCVHYRTLAMYRTIPDLRRTDVIPTNYTYDESVFDTFLGDILSLVVASWALTDGT